jgi:hypothetical protein
MPDYDDENDEDDLGYDEDPDPSDQDSTDDDGEECPHCGKYIFEDAAVCPHCLTPLDSDFHNWRPRKPWVTFGLLCLILILIASFYVFFRAITFGW